ncbi:hypothetical protein OF829_02630 [Sphingomonas sp. LB-2]|uniref:hypothetical protein n=1 Tax=Sphingomonas caeni TaxID=2984949 RepID=UPI00222E64BD|nr:hypothetical protein [Sphingomonas caeni]MCW3846117.1 hypothetical protein [Sphingomonas caeni]
MARFPKIDSPCPYKDNRAAIFDGDFCRMCKRNVVDLTAWSDGERAAFLASCETEVCVSYRLPIRPALAAAALAAAVAALPAAAQDAPATETPGVQLVSGDVPVDEDTEIWMGGIKDPKNTALTEDPADATLPEMPVVYEAPAVAVKPKEPVSGS